MGQEQSRIVRVGLVLALWLAGLAAAAQFAKISVVFDKFAVFYPDAGLGLGFLLSLISAVGVVFGIVGGVFVTRIGLRRVLIAALALGAMVSALQALMPPFPVMLGLRFLEGLSHLGVVIAAPTLIAQISEGRWQGAAMTLWGSFFGVAFALTALVGVPLADTLGVSALLLTHAGVMLAIGLLLATVLPPRPIEAQVQRDPKWFESHGRIYRSPRIGAAAHGWLFYTLTFVSLMAVLPGFISPEVRGPVMTVMPLGGIVVSMTVGVALLSIWPATTVVMLGFLVSACLAGAMAVVGPVPWVCVALFAALGLVQGASFAVVPELNPSPADRALGNGAMAQMGNLGNLTGTPILLAVTFGSGFAGLVWFAVLAYLCGMAVHLWMAARRGELRRRADS